MQEEQKVSSPLLVYQVTNLPDDGVVLEGEIPFSELDIQADDRFELPEPLKFKIHLEAAKQDIIARGTLDATVTAVCDRCAEPAGLVLHVDDVLHRYKNILGEPIDLTEDIREDILLAFPQSFHCREDCKGLCPTCGGNLNEGPCSCKNSDSEDDEGENPWTALSNLKL